MRDGKMHQTTVRFGPDLWQALEDECARLGVSAAQYVRESALARLAFTAGRTGAGRDYETALVAAGAVPLAPADILPAGTTPAVTPLEAARARAATTALDASAVGAQGQLARSRAREIRRQSQALREAHRAAGRRG
jgi:hypothetical protein